MLRLLQKKHRQKYTYKIHYIKNQQRKGDENYGKEQEQEKIQPKEIKRME